MSLFKKIVTLVLAMSLMTGCSLTNNADSQKVFNFADSGYVTSLDASKAIDETSTNVIQAFGDGLYAYDVKSKLKPAIAESKKVSDDGNSFETKGVFFYSDTLLYNSNYSLPAGKYLSIFYKGPSTRTKIAVDKLITFAKEHHMKIVGDPIEFCHIDDYETSIDDECLTEIQLPIK